MQGGIYDVTHTHTFIYIYIHIYIHSEYLFFEEGGARGVHAKHMGIIWKESYLLGICQAFSNPPYRPCIKWLDIKKLTKVIEVQG